MIRNLAAYHFVAIDDADALVERLRGFCLDAELKGTVLVAAEGINCFLAGHAPAVQAFIDWLRADPRFAAIKPRLSESTQLPFRRLLVKRKREIIRFDRECIDPAAGRAPTLAPATLKRWIAAGVDARGRELVLLDTRNQQEVAYGSFDRALSLPITRFTELPAALAAERERLVGKTVVSFCTGGVRCEKAVLWMQQAGYQNVWQLDGGILGYFDAVGGFGYRGRCFVFDSRVALDPGLRPLVDAAPAAAVLTGS